MYCNITNVLFCSVPEEIFTVDSKAPTSFDSYGTPGDNQELVGKLVLPPNQVQYTNHKQQKYIFIKFLRRIWRIGWVVPGLFEEKDEFILIFKIVLVQNRPPKQQRRPLPFLMYLSFFYTTFGEGSCFVLLSPPCVGFSFGRCLSKTLPAGPQVLNIFIFIFCAQRLKSNVDYLCKQILHAQNEILNHNKVREAAYSSPERRCHGL